MTTEQVVSRAGLRLSGPEMSRLLGIALIEYYNLNHGLLEEVRDRIKNTVSYRLPIHEGNDPLILRKLKMNHNRMAVFSAEEIASVRSL